MAWSYNHKDAIACWPEGEYECVIETVEEGTSGKGLPMLTVGLKCWNAEGKTRTVKEYIVNPSYLWPLKSMAKALGKVEEFEADKFHPGNYIGSNMMVSLRVEESDKYGDQNKCNGYKALDRAPTAKAAPKTAVKIPDDAKIDDDSIPF